MAKKFQVLRQKLSEVPQEEENAKVSSSIESEQLVPENSTPAPQPEPQTSLDPNSPIALIDKAAYKDHILVSLNNAYRQFCEKVDQAFDSFNLIKDGLKADLNKKLNEAAGTLVEKIYKS